MAYVALSDVQKFLGLTSSGDTSRLNVLLSQTTALIDGMLGNLKAGDREELIETRQVIHGRDIFLRTPNVSAIHKINGIDYEGEIEKDFFALRPQGRKVRIMNLCKYLNNDTMWKGVFKIEYKAGFDPIPEDIKMAQCLLIAYQYMKDGGKTILKYVMGPRTVQYDSADGVYNDAMKILNRYKQVNLLP